jgi:lipoprotein-releasing system permease protein
MSPNLLIAFRFLTAKKRSMLMSLSCIVLGVGLFIVTQATTSGFEQFFIKTILGSDGAVQILDKLQDTQRSRSAGGFNSGFEIASPEGVKYIEGIDEPGRLAPVIESFANISGISPVIKGEANITSSFKTENIRVFGIDLEKHRKVSNLEDQIIQGTSDGFLNSPSSAIVGREMADRLQLKVGDSFQLESLGQFRRYRVHAVFETGVSEIDRSRLYLNIGEARSLLHKTTGASYIQLAMLDPDRAPMDAVRLREVLGYSAQPWQDRQKSWLETFRALRISSAITVSVFTLIAGLAMFNTLAMIVLEKTKDIAILRSMGYTREDISRIFLWQATVVLLIGTVLGCVFGGVITYVVSQIPLAITGIFKTSHFVVLVSPWHYVQAVSTALVMVMVASLVPSRRAARLEPGDIVRGTAQ